MYICYSSIISVLMILYRYTHMVRLTSTKYMMTGTEESARTTRMATTRQAFATILLQATLSMMMLLTATAYRDWFPRSMMFAGHLSAKQLVSYFKFGLLFLIFITLCAHAYSPGLCGNGALLSLPLCMCMCTYFILHVYYMCTTSVLHVYYCMCTTGLQDQCHPYIL